MLGGRYHTNYQTNEGEYTRSNQREIPYVQSSLSGVEVSYDFPGEGVPKGLQSRINIGFMETGKFTLLNVNDLVQEKMVRMKSTDCENRADLPQDRSSRVPLPRR